MHPKSRLFCIHSILLAMVLCTDALLAQHDHGSNPSAAKAAARIGDPYAFDTCPISGNKLGAMGDPLVRLYEGREVRFCCGMCPAKFEKDLATNLAKLDAKVIADQAPLYPSKTSLVTGKELPEKPYAFVYGNRLIRLASAKERAVFGQNPEKFMAALDKAVVAAQGKDYPLTECPVTGEKLGGDMGKPVDFVIAGRLIRLGCENCTKQVEKDPAKYVAIIDAKRHPAQPHADKHPKEGSGTAQPHHK